MVLIGEARHRIDGLGCVRGVRVFSLQIEIYKEKVFIPILGT